MSTSTPGGEGRLRATVGTEGDDRIIVETGTIAVGNGGKDVFVLTSAGASGGSERLGAITDYVAGDDVLDLTQLGAKASILGEGRMIDGSTRLSIDYDGDGREDGYLYVGGAGFIPADDNFQSPMPIIDGEFHILPFPMPGDGEVIGGPVNDGEFHILPFPMPGDGVVEDGEMHILPFPMPGDGPFPVTVGEGEFHILPINLQTVQLGHVVIVGQTLTLNDFATLMAA
ncbi:M10 family metallopeptidase C-terminal domain-containing protein [Caulobacter sp. NIBR2454]|uniref:M10 family metallopeptidase C-terminal domain-containing protein n=1 Tax=Caulobacter sp. NIBR2454 TaxID=3015996 RepID=UPI0022B6A780|nr:hypothetical protein [Caulobacter sp. NIBR2454]